MVNPTQLPRPDFSVENRRARLEASGVSFKASPLESFLGVCLPKPPRSEAKDLSPARTSQLRPGEETLREQIRESMRVDVMVELSTRIRHNVGIGALATVVGGASGFKLISDLVTNRPANEFWKVTLVVSILTFIWSAAQAIRAKSHLDETTGRK